MSSKIEQLIDDIEEYINGCKFQPLSNTKIIVNKEEIDDLLRELRSKTPDEIRRYQKIISNQEAIENDAKQKAQMIIAEAEKRTIQLTSESEIMQQAYAQAESIVNAAANQAESLLNNAVEQSNAMKAAAVQYTDGLLAEVDSLLTRSIDATNAHYDALLTEYATLSEKVKSNRRDLTPPTPLHMATGAGAQTGVPVEGQPGGMPAGETPVSQPPAAGGGDELDII